MSIASAWPASLNSPSCSRPTAWRGRISSKAFNSFGVGSQVRQANARARAAKISRHPGNDGCRQVPHQHPQGRISQANMLKLAEYLIEKERAAQLASADS
jgi:thiol:disulfide interchange protein DsbA